jgi:hypothetical protein
MGMHGSQNGGNDPVVGSTVPDAGKCALTRTLEIQNLGKFDKICTIFTTVQPHFGG